MPRPHRLAPTMATSIHANRSRLSVWIVATIGIAVIGAIDYFTGVELRVFPLYYAPISLVAWHAGRIDALVAAALAALSWLGSNLLAGMQFSHSGFLIGNTLVQAASFATVVVLIATLKLALVRERELSRADPLTSLLNSRAFYEEAAGALAFCRRKKRPITLAYIDLDDFKSVNDDLGHLAGDQLLRNVALALRAATRPSDLCARLGGDEFAILLAETDAQQATVALERLRGLLEETTTAGASRVSGSIGAVTFLAVPDSLEEMISAADSRMYVAKAEGKNRLRLEIAGSGGS